MRVFALRYTKARGVVLGVTKRGNHLYKVASHPCDRQRRRGTRCCSMLYFGGLREDKIRGGEITKKGFSKISRKNEISVARWKRSERNVGERLGV